MKRLLSLTWLTALLAVLLTGCGAGGTQVAEGGMGGSGITMGRVTSFDPLTISGESFDTTESQFVYEEKVAPQLGDDSGLKVGMVVRVTSTYVDDAKIASQVEYAKLLQGTVTSNAVTPSGIGTLEVLGQVIAVNLETIYDDGEPNLDIPLDMLPPGAVIDLSGFTDGNGTILAARIELVSMTSDTDTPQEIKGIVSNLESDINRFKIGGLTVDYTGLTPPQGFGNEVLVEVKGVLTMCDAVDCILQADSLEIEGDGDLIVAEDGEWVVLEGFVTDAPESIPVDATEILFVLNGQQVLANELTDFDPGRNLRDITIGNPMKVDGRMAADILVADFIDIKVSPADKDIIVATLDGIDKEAGQLTLLGQTVSLLPSTLYEDEINPRFNLSKVEAGDYLELDVTLDESSNLVATRLKHKQGNGQVELQGMVQGFDPIDETFHVLNIRVHYPGLGGLGLAVGDRAELTGTYNEGGGIVEAETISITDNLQSTPRGLN